jgi:hypothetical protein
MCTQINFQFHLMYVMPYILYHSRKIRLQFHTNKCNIPGTCNIINLGVYVVFDMCVITKYTLLGKYWLFYGKYVCEHVLADWWAATANLVLRCVVLCRVIEAASLPTLSLLFFQLRDNYCKTFENCTVVFCLPKRRTSSDANIKPRRIFFISIQFHFLLCFLTFLTLFLIWKEELSVSLIVRTPVLIITMNYLLKFFLILTIRNEIYQTWIFLLLVFFFSKGSVHKIILGTSQVGDKRWLERMNSSLIMELFLEEFLGLSPLFSVTPHRRIDND